MPWYKAGTVSVVLNSATVTGANTQFAANTRVGDAFRGPDGRWYEIVNVASDTVLSISPAYQGATASGGSYALAPMQGYVKDSADTLRSLVNQFGSKLAALGTTGNYDILPVAKGGTGGATAADARANLGLGAVATENVLPVNKGGTGGNTQAAARAALGIKTGDVKWRANRGNLSITSDFYTTIDWTNDVYGTGGIHSQTSNPDAFVLPVGIFLVNVSVTFDYAPAGRRGVRITLGGAAVPSGTQLNPVTPNGITTVILTYVARITTAGTILRVQAFQDSGASLNLPMSGNNAIDIYQLE